MNIGFIGLGVMGTPMVGHLARAGHRLTLLDIDRSTTERVAGELGAQAAATAADLARASEIIITMLPNGEVVQQVVSGEHGVLQGVQPGALLLDTSSAEPWLTEQAAAALAERGATMVDAPVSGAAWGTQEGKLVFHQRRAACGGSVLK